MGDKGLSLFVCPCFISFALSVNPLEKIRRRLIIRVLLHQLAADGQVQDEAPQLWHGVGCLDDAVEML